jgi:hypothetical protein
MQVVAGLALSHTEHVEHGHGSGSVFRQSRFSVPINLAIDEVLPLFVGEILTGGLSTIRFFENLC